MNLDHFQKQAAYHNFPYSVIIAGAGTGKTNTLIGRIQYLISVKKLKPKEILVISFTNEAVQDLQRKIKSILNISVTVFTFHKLAIFLLRSIKNDILLSNENDFSYLTHEFIFGICSENNALQKTLWKTFHFFSFTRCFSQNLNSSQLSQLTKDLMQFIYLAKAYSYDLNDIYDKIHHFSFQKKNFLILSYILFHLYELEKKSQKKLDFDDLIYLATQNINCVSNFPFRHILIDEFQDSSKNRIQLFQKLVEHFQLEFTVVGDDCQSIYRFSGTQTNCFSYLSKIFKNCKYFYLSNTYRNSEELVLIANSFIQKNTKQIKKSIHSLKTLEFPIEILFYAKTTSIYKILNYIFSYYAKTILFLGRNSFDLNYYFSQQEIIWKDKKHFSLKAFPNKEFIFLTVHQSKGLEADLVIIIHLENALYGFPCQKNYSFYFPNFFFQDEIAYEEERRLFYVALTRTKGKVFLLTPYQKPSSFVKELIHDYALKIKTLYF